jgi:hypothetical protein
MAIAKRTSRDGKRVTGYQVLVDVRDPVTKARKRYTVGTYRTRKMAERYEREALDRIEAGTFDPNPPAPPKVLTVRNVVETWFDGKKQHVQPNTASGYQSAIELHLLPALGDVPVRDLTRAAVKV